jgi:hypothetical protein
MDDQGSGKPGDAPAGEQGPASPEAALQDLGAPVVETSLLPISMRDSWFFAYDDLLSQPVASRFTKGMHAGKIVSLPNYKLVWPYFHLPTQTALPSLERTNDAEDVVWGWLYDARGIDFSVLDYQRRIPNRYHHSQVRVLDRGGRRFPALTYVLTLQDIAPGKPSKDYRDRLVTAAAERNLPEEWLTQLRGIETTD